MRPEQPYNPKSRNRRAKVRALQRAMDQTGLTRSQIAILADVGKGTVYRFIRNEPGYDVTLGTWEKLERLLDSLEIDYRHPPVNKRPPVATGPPTLPWQE